EHAGPCELRYHDIGDYLSREEKLAIIEDFASIDRVPWRRITPNAEGDWINQRDPAFDAFVPLGDKDDATANTVFEMYSQGVLTSRDAWAYNFSREALADNMRRMIETYEAERERYAQVCKGKERKDRPPVEQVVETDPKKISWSGNLKNDLARGKTYEFQAGDIVPSMYRPFTRQWLYFNRRFNERVYQQPRLFPTPRHENVVICAAGSGANKPFSAFVTANVPDYELVSKGQGFPLYWYEHGDEARAASQGEMFGDQAEPDADGYIRREAISD